MKRNGWWVIAFGALLATSCARFQAATAPTKEQYVAAADQICTDAEATIAEIEQEAVENPDPTRNQLWIRRDLVPAYRGMAAQLRGLPPPSGDEVYLAGLYGDLDHVIALLHASPSRGRALVRDDEDVRRRFASYGMKVCGSV